jgi:hypothetical protein
METYQVKRLWFTVATILWMFTGFLAGFKDVREWMGVSLLIIGLAWFTATWCHRRFG